MTAPKPPAGARKPQDRATKGKAAAAAATEAAVPDGPIEFFWEEHKYIIEPGFEDDVEILEDIEDDKFVSVSRRILGAKQWDQWKERNRGADGRVRTSSAKDFLEALFEELGQGN